jgi:hypothetical protein
MEASLGEAVVAVGTAADTIVADDAEGGRVVRSASTLSVFVETLADLEAGVGTAVVSEVAATDVLEGFGTAPVATVDVVTVARVLGAGLAIAFITERVVAGLEREAATAAAVAVFVTGGAVDVVEGDETDAASEGTVAVVAGAEDASKE